MPEMEETCCKMKVLQNERKLFKSRKCFKNERNPKQKISLHPSTNRYATVYTSTSNSTPFFSRDSTSKISIFGCLWFRCIEGWRVGLWSDAVAIEADACYVTPWHMLSPTDMFIYTPVKVYQSIYFRHIHIGTWMGYIMSPLCQKTFSSHSRWCTTIRRQILFHLLCWSVQACVFARSYRVLWTLGSRNPHSWPQRRQPRQESECCCSTCHRNLQRSILSWGLPQFVELGEVALHKFDR